MLLGKVEGLLNDRTLVVDLETRERRTIRVSLGIMTIRLGSDIRRGRGSNSKGNLGGYIILLDKLLGWHVESWNTLSNRQRNNVDMKTSNEFLMH